MKRSDKLVRQSVKKWQTSERNKKLMKKKLIDFWKKSEKKWKKKSQTIEESDKLVKREGKKVTNK